MDSSTVARSKGRLPLLHLGCGEFADPRGLAHGSLRDKRPEKRRRQEVLDVSAHAVGLWISSPINQLVRVDVHSS